MRPLARLLSLCALMIAVACLLPRASLAGQASGVIDDVGRAPAALVMISEPGCPYCARFDREVGQGYMASELGRLAPLVRRSPGAADVRFIKGVGFSPTFVLLVEGREIGRIVGYPGVDLFWMQVDGLFARSGLNRPRAAGGSGAEPRVAATKVYEPKCVLAASSSWHGSV